MYIDATSFLLNQKVIYYHFIFIYHIKNKLTEGNCFKLICDIYSEDSRGVQTTKATKSPSLRLHIV